MNKLDQELRDAKSVKAMLDILNKYYDLDNCQPSAITKGILIAGLKKAVGMVNPKPRK